jgi:RNA polymerase sigma factor (sigma-70 family)
MDIMGWMSEPDDHQLLAEFARAESEPAFAALVARYINLVFSTAFRFTGNAHHAEEITQAVFIILARKAGKLSPRVVLSGWLYQVARLTSANFMKREIRRQRREQEAYMQSALNEPHDNAWHAIAPLLDDAMGKLGQTDRDAVVLRYFENKSAAEIGAALQMNEETARRRVNRALEKLHRYFKQRGISSTTTGIAGAISANSVHAAPVALTQTVTPLAVAKGSLATVSILTLVKGTLNYMLWNKLKLAMAVGTAVILAAGTTTLVAQHASQTNAIIPYKTLDDACRFADSVDQSKLVLRILIDSSKKSVRPQDIHLTIQSREKAPISLQLGGKGEILNFPHDETLRRENPGILSDQPKGTLSLGLWCYVPMPKELTFPYRRMADAVAEANQARDTANQMIKEGYADQVSPFKDKVQGLVFVFPKSSAGKAKVEIATAGGKKEYIADADGLAVVEVEPALQAENPPVTLSENPKWVVLAAHWR